MQERARPEAQFLERLRRGLSTSSRSLPPFTPRATLPFLAAGYPRSLSKLSIVLFRFLSHVVCPPSRFDPALHDSRSIRSPRGTPFPTRPSIDPSIPHSRDPPRHVFASIIIIIIRKKKSFFPNLPARRLFSLFRLPPSPSLPSLFIYRAYLIVRFGKRRMRIACS